MIIIWSLPLREEHILRLFEKSMLRRIFEIKWEQVVGSQRRLHNKEHCRLCASPNISVFKSRTMRWAGHVACTGEMRNAHNILARKSEGKNPFRRP
jgi:cbb3-type cytochrome oxidase cytochrome c subunit